MRRLLAVALLALAALAPAQEIKFGLGQGGGGISTITSGTTPTSGCNSIGVFRSASNLVDCGAGLTFGSGVFGVGTASSLRGRVDLFGATHAFRSSFQVSESQSATATYTLPVNDGAAGEFLQASDGAGVLAWANPFTGQVVRLGFVLTDPSGARDVVIWYANVACTVTAIRAYTTGGTSANINARKNGSSALLAGDLTANAGAWTSTTTIQNASFSVADSLEVRLISLSGSPTAVAFQVECTR